MRQTIQIIMYISLENKVYGLREIDTNIESVDVSKNF